MADDAVANFTAFTGADPERAAQYLKVTDNNVEQAVSLFFETGGSDLGTSLPSESTRPAAGSSSDQAIPVDDDSAPTGAADQAEEDDEAMARRLQNEMYGPAGGGAGARQDDIDPETGVRAPMARTTETLADPVGYMQDDPEEMRAAVLEQMRQRHARRQQGKLHIQILHNGANKWFQVEPASSTSKSMPPTRSGQSKTLLRDNSSSHEPQVARPKPRQSQTC